MLVPAATTTTTTIVPSDDRLRLIGKGDRLLRLVLRHAPPSHLWAQWLRLPLASAAADGDTASVGELLAAGADGKAGPRGPDGYTLLHSAAKGGSEWVVTALLDAGSGPDVNERTQAENRECPLHIAARLGHSGASAALIRAGADVNSRDLNGWTPLHLAARFGRIEVVMDLLREGADRDAEDVNGYRPLHYATMWGQPATIKALLKAGAALESITRVDGTRPLHIAARYASAAIVRDLLREGAEKDAKNARGFTPLHAAAASNKTGAISLLLAAGADINLPSGHQRFTPLHLAARRGAVEACAALLGAGASVRVRTIDGSTPLHLASLALKSSAVRLLLRHGSDEAALDSARHTPADVAGLYLASQTNCGVGSGGENKELIREIRERLERAPADRAWARRGWLVLARVRLARRRPRGSTRNSRGSSNSGESLKDKQAETDGKDAGQTDDQSSTTRVAALADSRDDDGAVVDARVEGGEKRTCWIDLRRDEGGISGGGGSSTSSVCFESSSSDLFARVAGLEEVGIFKKILSFL